MNSYKHKVWKSLSPSLEEINELSFIVEPLGNQISLLGHSLHDYENDLSKTENEDNAIIDYYNQAGIRLKESVHLFKSVSKKKPKYSKPIPNHVTKDIPKEGLTPCISNLDESEAHLISDLLAYANEFGLGNTASKIRCLLLALNSKGFNRAKNVQSNTGIIGNQITGGTK